MRRVIGQAGRRFGRLVHWAVRLVLLVVVAGTVGLAALAWRLDHAPLDLPWLAERIETMTAGADAPLRLSVGGAVLVWEGFRQGVDRPLDVRLSDVEVRDRDGTRLVFLPQVEVSLSLRALALGRIVPRALEIEGARLRLVRQVDGQLAVEFAGATAPSKGPDLLSWVMEELATAPRGDLLPSGSVLSQVRRLRLRDAAVTLLDRQLDVVWEVPQAELDLQRGSQGGLDGTATVHLLLGEERLRVEGRVTLPPGGRALAVEATMPTVEPARFAAFLPAMAPLRMVQVPVALSLTGELGPDLMPRHARVQARLGRGTLHVGKGRLPVAGGMVELDAAPDGLQLTLHRLDLMARTDQPPVVMQGSARLGERAGMLAGSMLLQADRIDFADLGVLWPDGLGGPGAKKWVAGNITSGLAHRLRIELAVLAAPDLSHIRVTSLTGGVEGRDLVVHWLRPVPPAQGVNADLRFLSADEIEITVLSGRQSGITLTSGTVRLTGLERRDQYAAISMAMTGPVPDLFAVLRHPRVNLLDKRPIPMRNPAGQVEGRLTILALPLEDDLTLDDVRLMGSGRVTGLHLGGTVAGRDLSDGALTYEVTNEALRLRGTATLAGIASDLQVSMDFTDGPASQVIQRVGVTATPTMAQLAALGLELPELVLDGAAGAKLEMTSRRGGRSEVTVRADLGRVAMKAARLNWEKPAGRAASTEVRVQLDRDRLVGVDRIRLDGEGLDVQAQLDMAGGAPQRLRLARVLLGPGTDLRASEIVWPRSAGAPWEVRLVGASLDATSEFGAREPVARPAAQQRGPPWTVDARLDRLVLGPGRTLTGLTARAAHDGLVMRSGEVKGRAGTGAFALTVTPATGPAASQRRSLAGSAQDAGGLLAALDVTEHMRGGQMTLNGSWDDSRPDHRLSGTAEIASFSMRNAPAIGKLLQALTVYGAVEALQGPDLGFSQLIAPFHLAGDLLDLEDARAYSASLGMTVKGRVDLNHRTLDLQGTVVPAYFLNSLLGRIPLVGRLLSPEAGGGLFAMSYGVRGPMSDPSVWVNPLSAVTPGFLRGIFGIFEPGPGGGAEPRPSPQFPPDEAKGGQN